jgi:sulfatase maturation enzyme AslB (radical SAM superfamily)
MKIRYWIYCILLLSVWSCSKHKTDNKTSYKNNLTIFLERYNNKNKEKCDLCEYKNLCSTCIAINKAPMNDYYCRINKKFLERILKFFVDINENGGKQKFIDNFNRWFKTLGVTQV